MDTVFILFLLFVLFLFSYYMFLICSVFSVVFLKSILYSLRIPLFSLLVSYVIKIASVIVIYNFQSQLLFSVCKRDFYRNQFKNLLTSAQSFFSIQEILG
jgi:hypothetical protein